MITKALTGQRLRGLIEYLYGEGKQEEHTAPRLVGAWDPAVLDHQPQNKVERGLMVADMESPVRLFGVQLPEAGAVYHVPISLHVDDGVLTDEQWRQVAQVAVDKLGFSAADDRAGCPWVAVRHGLSAAGNDHIHLVAHRVREDGTVASLSNDYRALSELRAEMEAYFELTPTNSRGAGRAPAERDAAEAATKRSQSGVEPRRPVPTPAQRASLARTVRAAANGATSEADFVTRMRRAGLLARPRWATGSRTDVVGYAVAAKPTDRNQTPTWSSGGKLARDLSLPAVRQRWGQPTTTQRQADIHAWRPPKWRRATIPPPEPTALRTEAWDHAQQVVADARTQLAGVTPGDGAAWASASREAAGTLAGLVARVDGARGRQLAAAADACAQAAVVEHGQPRGRRCPQVSRMAGAARVATDVWIAGHGGATGVAQLVSQLQRLTEAIGQAHAAAGRAAHAAAAETAARQMRDYLRGVNVADPTRPTGAVPAHIRSEPGRSEHERGR